MFLFKLIALLLPLTFFLAVSATALAGFLVLTGQPDTCVDRSVRPAPEATAELQANWFDVLQRVNAGETVPLSVTEEQATAIGSGYLRGEDVDVENLNVIFCPDGTAEATGKVSVAGLSSDVLVKGTLDLSGPQPVVDIESVKAGSLPGFVGARIVDLLLDEQVLTLPLTANILALEVNDGEAIVAVGP